MKNKFIAILFGLLGLSLVISISAAQIVSGFLLLLWIYNWAFSEKSRSFRHSLALPLAVYIAWGIFVTSLHHVMGPLEAFTTQSGIFLFFVLFDLLDESRFRILVRWFVIGAVFVSILGIFQYLSGNNFRPNEKIYWKGALFQKWPDWSLSYLSVRNDRVVGTRSHPLTFSESLIPALFLIIFPFFQKNQNEQPSLKKTLLNLISFLLVLAAILLSQSRAVVLGFVLGFVALIYFAPKHLKIKSLAALLILGSLILGFSPKIRGRILSTFSNSDGAVSDQQSKQIRFELWNSALKEINISPWTGAGLKGAQLRNFNPVYSREEIRSEAHNIFLQSLVELGVVGFGLFIWVLIIILKLIFKLPLSLKPVNLAIYISFLVAGLTESWFGDKEIAMIFWCFVGCFCFLLRTKGNDVRYDVQ